MPMTDAAVAEAVNTARDHEKSGRYPQAEAIYRQLAHAFPDHAPLLEKLMEMLFLQRRMDDAYGVYREFAGRQRDFDDAEFESAYVQAMRATAAKPWPLRRRVRLHTLVQLLGETGVIDGDVAECGCYQGLSSYLMCSYLRKRAPGFRGARYHIFDSFQGLSEPTLEDDVPDGAEQAERIRTMCVTGAFAASLGEVKRNLAGFPEIEFHPGWIPLSFHRLPERRYRFVHVDVDLYDPTLESFEYFYPRLAPGGIMVSDDFVWPGARRAIEEFCSARNIRCDVTPHDQAVVRCTR